MHDGRTSFSASPCHLEVSDEAEMAKNVARASAASALASSVLPLPEQVCFTFIPAHKLCKTAHIYHLCVLFMLLLACITSLNYKVLDKLTSRQ